MDLDSSQSINMQKNLGQYPVSSVLFHKHAKELGQYPAILTYCNAWSVNLIYIIASIQVYTTTVYKVFLFFVFWDLDTVHGLEHQQNILQTLW